MVWARFEFWNDPEIGAKEATPQFGDQLLPCSFSAVPGITAEIPPDASGIGGPMNCFVA